MTASAPDNTISIQRIVKIVVITAIGFAVGFMCMAMLNVVGSGLAGLSGVPSSGRGNTSSQLWAGGVFAVIGAAVGVWWTRGKDTDPYATRVSRRAAGLGLLAAVLTPLAVIAFSITRQNAVEQRQFVDVLMRGGEPAFDAAEELVRSGGAGRLRDLLRDKTLPGEIRLIAGLELVEYRVDRPADLALLEPLIRRPSPLRERFVQIYFKQESVDWSPTIERWMITVLDDPEPSMRLSALSLLISNSSESSQLCAAFKQLARDSDPNVRAEAMLRVSACPRDRIPDLLKEGTRDPDPAVRLGVLTRLGWRVAGLDDAAGDLAIRREISGMLLDDPDPSVRAAAIARHDDPKSRQQ